MEEGRPFPLAWDAAIRHRRDEQRQFRHKQLPQIRWSAAREIDMANGPIDESEDAFQTGKPLAREARKNQGLPVLDALAAVETFLKQIFKALGARTE